MRIRAKIHLALSSAFLVGICLASAGAYKILKDNAIEDSLQSARIMIEGASAIRAYTDQNISPLLEPQMKIQFLPYAVPSFAAQSNFRFVQHKLPEYAYREPALNPTNVNDRAADWEADIINEFRNNDGRREFTMVRQTVFGPVLVLARPLKVGSEACLVCHSKPEVAPPTMLALYGDKNGFGWKLNEIVAAQVVSIPIAVAIQRVYSNLALFVAALVVTFLVVVLMVDLLLRAIVVKPIIAISEMASQVSMGDLEAPTYVRNSNDEVGSLSASFNRMRASLQNAIKMLEQENETVGS